MAHHIGTITTNPADRWYNQGKAPEDMIGYDYPGGGIVCSNTIRNLDKLLEIEARYQAAANAFFANTFADAYGPSTDERVEMAVAELLKPRVKISLDLGV